jgi:hypothetical protein
MSTSLLISILAGLAIAQTTTLTIDFYGYDSTNFVAAVVSAQPSATVLSLGCPQSSECGLFPYQTLTYGPSTYKMDMSVPGEGFTMTQDCKTTSGTAVCVESASGSEANFPGSSTETYDVATDGGVTVTVTEGAEKLGKSAMATPTGSGAVVTSTPSASARSTPSGTAAMVTQVSNTPAATSAPAEKTSTGAAAVNAVAVGGGLVGVAAGFLGGLLL